MQNNNYSITFACYKALDYTKECIESLKLNHIPLENVVVVDNASKDGTQEYLNSLPLGKAIINKKNLGCGVAWNQGVLAFQTEWTIVMNNDIIVYPHFVENLINHAIQTNIPVLSPALIEGEHDYDSMEFYQTYAKRTSQALRKDEKHAVCMLIHESVFDRVGYFRAEPHLLGFEDTLFFHALDKAGIKTAMSAASWIHHYGSITQTLMKQERGLHASDDLGYRHNDRLLNQTWIEKKYKKMKRIWRNKRACNEEIRQYGVSLHGLRHHGKFDWI